MISNPLVEFLASYGPQPSSNNLYDEFVVDTAERTGCEPIEIGQPLVAELEDMFRSSSPRSVILTGTAGDGKTYTARKLVEALAGPDAVWGSTDKTLDLPAANGTGRRIRFIKDLSELNEADKDRIFPEVRASLTGEGKDDFVICVNDGHLLKFFRDREDGLEGRISHMMQEDAEDDPDGHFRLINMSRRALSDDLFDRIIDAVAGHPKWTGCAGCPALESESNPCPIRSNLDILRHGGAGSMRARLKDMIRMAAANGRHVSIRHLILHTVNVLLGDRRPGKSLLTCSRARKRASDEDYWATNPYANAFGENLIARERERFVVFSVLSEFGVGHETNNFFDHNLLWGTESLPPHPVYGSRIFASSLRQYQQEPSTSAQRFNSEMVDQRRRLFFSIDPEAPATRANPRKDPWNLSTFRYGASWISLANALHTSDGRIPPDIRRGLVQGLNRMMTGEMTATHERIWLTAPAGVYRGHEIPLLVAHAGQRSQGGTFVQFLPADAGRKAPVLRVTPMGRTERAVDLDLRPTLVECLLRIADGALPASFSTECRQDIERFRLRVTKAVAEACEPHQPPPLEQIEMIDGRLQSRPIDIMATEEDWG